MKDTIELFWTNVQVRVRDPFWGTFLVSWILSNWKFFLFLFYPMDWDLESRLNHISSELYAPWYGWGAAKLVLFPLAASLVYLLVLPKGVNWIDRQYQSSLIDRRNARVQLQGKLLITTEDKQALMDDLDKTRRAHDSAMAALSKAGQENMSQQKQYEGTMRAMQTQLTNLHMELNALKNPHMPLGQVPLPPIDLAEEMKRHDQSASGVP